MLAGARTQANSRLNDSCYAPALPKSVLHRGHLVSRRPGGGNKASPTALQRLPQPGLRRCGATQHRAFESWTQQCDGSIAWVCCHCGLQVQAGLVHLDGHTPGWTLLADRLAPAARPASGATTQLIPHHVLCAYQSHCTCEATPAGTQPCASAVQPPARAFQGAIFPPAPGCALVKSTPVHFIVHQS